MAVRLSKKDEFSKGDYYLAQITCNCCGSERHIGLVASSEKKAMAELNSYSGSSYCESCSTLMERKQELTLLFGEEFTKKDFRHPYLEKLIASKLELISISKEGPLNIILGPLVPYSSHPQRSDYEGGWAWAYNGADFYNQLRIERSAMLRAWIKGGRK